MGPLPTYPEAPVTTPMLPPTQGAEPPAGWGFCPSCDTLGVDLETDERCERCLGRGICRTHEPPAGHSWCSECDTLGFDIGSDQVCKPCGGRGIIRLVPAGRGGAGAPQRNDAGGRNLSDEETAWLCGVPRSIVEAHGG